tara:strand:+ start:27959 stop:29806 length:1848 start_codon:yes stop_codon:yes gene_type:complete
MAIKRYYAEADNTITNAFDTVLSQRGTGSNAGANDVLETFSIYGQYSTSSTELSRILIKFPVTGTTSVKADRDASNLPASGSVKFYLKMFNARHQEQLPENLILSIFPVARNWEEGTGIDLVNHADKTKDVIPGSNWVNRTKGVAWVRNGGDYISGSANSAVWSTASFVTGSEDLEVDVTDVVEEWISSTEVKATATITFTEKPHEATTITLVDGDGTSATFEIDDNEDGVVAGNIAMNPASDDAAGMATILFQKVNASALKITATNPSSGQVVLTQDTAGRVGNTTITYSNSTSWSDNTSGTLPTAFTGGTGVVNYGFGIMVTSSQEAYRATADSGSELQNTDGITKSTYTKRFYSRSSEYFFRRPVIEARWEDRISDDRNKFFASSSLCSTQNTQSVYLYNYIDGVLTNLPDESVTINFYASSGSLPSGSSIANTTATKVSTGIYRAALAINTTESVLHDVWSETDGGSVYHTGTISVRTRSASDSNKIGDFISNITNLKDTYKRTENARIKVFVRRRNECPTVYTVATSVAEGETIVSASYSVVRDIDNKIIFQHSTGSSDRHTFLSYDNSGSYFDFDMSLLEAGYMYGFKFAYYAAGKWREQEELFKFRVE